MCNVRLESGAGGSIAGSGVGFRTPRPMDRLKLTNLSSFFAALARPLKDVS